jgi:hypothetical protein
MTRLESTNEVVIIFLSTISVKLLWLEITLVSYSLFCLLQFFVVC